MDATRRTYDEIADLWKKYRTKPFDEVIEFFRGVENSLVLDVGCGTGRNLKAIPSSNFVVELDYSYQMLKLNPHKIKVLGDVRNLPFKNNVFDIVLAVSVFNHLNEADLKVALGETKRVLKKGGKMLATFWKRDEFEEGRPVSIPWTKDGKKLERVYFFYGEKTIKKLIEEYLKLDKLYIDKKGMNYILEARK